MAKHRHVPTHGKRPHHGSFAMAKATKIPYNHWCTQQHVIQQSFNQHSPSKQILRCHVIAFLAWKAHLALIHVDWHPSAVVSGGSEYSQVKALNTHSAADS